VSNRPFFCRLPNATAAAPLLYVNYSAPEPPSANSRPASHTHNTPPPLILPVIIAASDGLFDNMWDEQLLSVLGGALGWPVTAAAAAARGAPEKPLHRRSLSFKSFSSWGRLSQAATHQAAAQQASAAAQPAAAAQQAEPQKSHHSVTFAPQGGVTGMAGLRRIGSRASRLGARTGSLPNLRRSDSEDGGASVAASSDAGSSSADSVVTPTAAAAAGADDAQQQQDQEQQQQQPPAPAPKPAPAELAQRAADALARAAFRNASDDHFRSPWAVAAGRQGLIARLFAHGGKMDDCTCVVAIVKGADGLGATAAA
jgi:hypothetical protein